MESPTGFGATPAGPLDAAAETANQAVRAFSNTTGKNSTDATTADAGSALLTVAASLDYLATATRQSLDGQEAATRYEITAATSCASQATRAAQNAREAAAATVQRHTTPTT
jgi:hypothetical protein